MEKWNFIDHLKKISNQNEFHHVSIKKKTISNHFSPNQMIWTRWFFFSNPKINSLLNKIRGKTRRDKDNYQQKCRKGGKIARRGAAISLIISRGVPYMNKGNFWGAGKIKLAFTHYNQVVLNKSYEQYCMILI